jgi:hypothetical protein
VKKIISLFQRDYDGDRLCRDEIVPGAEWVVYGEGRATEKYDGMACAVIKGQLYRRYDAKGGKLAPLGFIPAQDPDPITKHWPGWVLVSDGPEDQWHREAWDHLRAVTLFGARDGTYELVGPKVQGNPYDLESHVLWLHGEEGDMGVDDRTFDALRDYLSRHPIEGIVFHRENGDMVKVKARDFGLPWPWSGKEPIR